MPQTKRIVEGSNEITFEESDSSYQAYKVFINDAYVGDIGKNDIEDFIKGFDLLIKLYRWK